MPPGMCPSLAGEHPNLRSVYSWSASKPLSKGPKIFWPTSGWPVIQARSGRAATVVTASVPVPGIAWGLSLSANWLRLAGFGATAQWRSGT